MDWFKHAIDTYPYYIIVVLAAVIYELGFARKLPLLKKLFTYVLLAIGCIPLTIFKVLGLPIVEAMVVAFIILVFARIRRTSVTRENEGLR